MDFDERAIPWDNVSKTGAFGDPTQATREKGLGMLDFVTAKAVGIVASFKTRASEARTEFPGDVKLRERAEPACSDSPVAPIKAEELPPV